MEKKTSIGFSDKSSVGSEKVFNGVNFGMEKYLRETKMLDYSSKTYSD